MVVPASVSSVVQAPLKFRVLPAMCYSSCATVLVRSITWFLSCVASFKLCGVINNRVVMLASQATASLNRSAYVAVVRFSGSLSNKAQQSLPLVAGTPKTLRFFGRPCARRYGVKRALQYPGFRAW